MSHKILRLPAVINITGLSRSTIYLKMSRGEFPEPISLGERAVGWLEQDIENWLDERLLATRLGN